MAVLLVDFVVFNFISYITRYTTTIPLKPIHTCDLAHCSESVLEIVLPSVQQEPNGVDCGVFAIAFAVDILNRFAEIGKRFDVRK